MDATLRSLPARGQRRRRRRRLARKFQSPNDALRRSACIKTPCGPVGTFPLERTPTSPGARSSTPNRGYAVLSLKGTRRFDSKQLNGL
jgi:hypothetical protein